MHPTLQLRHALDLTPLGAFDYTPPAGARPEPFYRALIADANALGVPFAVYIGGTLAYTGGSPYCAPTVSFVPHPQVTACP